ncbi:MAG: hypothetical protein HOG49_33640 [Candidatus Scalindua sp.]|jgi:hypothetical protein|nr:hypothetical protein [Candidatus Scalindua sp.]
MSNLTKLIGIFLLPSLAFSFNELLVGKVNQEIEKELAVVDSVVSYINATGTSDDLFVPNSSLTLVKLASLSLPSGNALLRSPFSGVDYNVEVDANGKFILFKNVFDQDVVDDAFIFNYFQNHKLWDKGQSIQQDDIDTSMYHLKYTLSNDTRTIFKLYKESLSDANTLFSGDLNVDTGAAKIWYIPDGSGTFTRKIKSGGIWIDAYTDSVDQLSSSDLGNSKDEDILIVTAPATLPVPYLHGGRGYITILAKDKDGVLILDKEGDQIVKILEYVYSSVEIAGLAIGWKPIGSLREFQRWEATLSQMRQQTIDINASVEDRNNTVSAKIIEKSVGGSGKPSIGKLIDESIFGQHTWAKNACRLDVNIVWTPECGWFGINDGLGNPIDYSLDWFVFSSHYTGLKDPNVLAHDFDPNTNIPNLNLPLHQRMLKYQHIH